MLQPQHLTKAISKIMADKRSNDRFKAVFSGIIMSNGTFLSHCIIRDVSSTGMKIECEGGTGNLPEKFHIKTPEIPEILPVILVWEKGEEAGVTIVSEEEFNKHGMDAQQSNVA